jgi:hypothetical protein
VKVLSRHWPWGTEEHHIKPTQVSLSRGRELQPAPCTDWSVPDHVIWTSGSRCTGWSIPAPVSWTSALPCAWSVPAHVNWTSDNRCTDWSIPAPVSWTPLLIYPVGDTWNLICSALCYIPRAFPVVCLNIRATSNETSAQYVYCD